VGGRRADQEDADRVAEARVTGPCAGPLPGKLAKAADEASHLMKGLTFPMPRAGHSRRDAIPEQSSKKWQWAASAWASLAISLLCASGDGRRCLLYGSGFSPPPI